MMGPIEPPDHGGLGDLDEWDTEGLKTAYVRLIRELRNGERDADDMEQVTQRIEVENELAARGVDPRPIAKRVGTE